MTATILICDDEENARKNITDFFQSLGYDVLEAGSLARARQWLNEEQVDIIILDVRLPDGYGPDLLDEIATLPIRPQTIIVTAHGEINMAVDAIKKGAQDFLQKPLVLEELENSVIRAEENVSMRKELAHLRRSQMNMDNFIIGNSPMMLEAIDMAQRTSQAQRNTVIAGPTGSGKEILAKYIHSYGPRAGKAFIDINCAAIQSTMVESELFGHEKGAFTDADKRKIGLMELADGGILFLDEIGTMPADMQSKLLRAIEDKSFRRVGGTTSIRVDVQLISASNQNLLDLVEKQLFRNDLYYRLNTITIELPGLAHRRNDIPDFVGFFLRKSNAEQSKNILDVSPRAMDALKNYNWPGNIRELRNIIERAVLLCDDPTIDLRHLPSDLRNYAP